MDDKDNENKALSRRHFFKVASGAAAGAALCGTPVKVEDSEASTAAVPVSNAYIVYDSTKCAGCFSCMLACTCAHDGGQDLSLSRIQIIRNSFGRYPDDIQISVCRQCVTPLCVQACPTDACHVNTHNGNVRVIGESKCIGCQKCIEACPFIPHRTIWNAEKKKSTKCDLCINTQYFSETGGPNGKQACVEVCPMGALSLTTSTPSQTDTDGYDVTLVTKEAENARRIRR